MASASNRYLIRRFSSRPTAQRLAGNVLMRMRITHARSVNFSTPITSRSARITPRHSFSVRMPAAISRSTGGTARAIEAIEKYSITVGSLAGANPHQIGYLTGYLGQAGITGSTAGTGLSRIMLEGLKLDDASPGSHSVMRQGKARQDLERALKGEGVDIGSTVHPSRGVKKSEEIERDKLEMGLVDRGGKKMYLDDKGNIDIMKMIAIVSDWSAKMDEHGKHAEAAGKILDVFKIQAARALEPFLGAENQAQLRAYMENTRYQAEQLTAQKMQEQHSLEAKQQFEQGLKSMEDALIAVSKGPLQMLGAAAQHAADGLQGLAAWFDKHEHEAASVGNAGVGALVGGLVGAPFGQAAAGAAIGAGAVGAGTYLFGNGGIFQPMDLTQPQAPVPGTDPAQNPWRVQPQSYHPDSGPTVHIQEINFHGVEGGEDAAEKFTKHLIRVLSGAQLHDLGSGGGYTSSPYASGRGVSA